MVEQWFDNNREVIPSYNMDRLCVSEESKEEEEEA